MKVSELIDALKTMPADAQVLVQGYEDGYDNIKVVRQIPVAKNPKDHDWSGEYDDADETDKKAFPAVVILGNRR